MQVAIIQHTHMHASSSTFEVNATLVKVRLPFKNLKKLPSGIFSETVRTQMFIF